MDTAIDARLTRLEQKIAELERENQLLRAVVPGEKQDERESEALPRRDLLKGAAYALGAVGLSLMGTLPAEASTGFMQYGNWNDAGTSGTTLASSSAFTLQLANGSRAQQGDPESVQTLLVSSSGGHAVHVFSNYGSVGDGVNVFSQGDGHGVQVDKRSEFGHGVLAYQKSTTGFYAAIAGVTSNGGPGLHGRGEGTGNGVWGQIADSAKPQSAVIGTTEGTGAAIEGNSILGRGGLFKGRKAQIRLVASSAANKPSTGTRGDLFVDSTGRLWYCKTSGSTTGWKQLA